MLLYCLPLRSRLDLFFGFISLQRLDIRGRIKTLHGQNRKTEEPPLALFCICTPFGPPSLLEMPQKEVMFKSKHKLDLAVVSFDPRGREVLGFSDGEVGSLGVYDLVHPDDLAYVASAHQECKSLFSDPGHEFSLFLNLKSKITVVSYVWRCLQKSVKLF